jgi:hypothetical protein
MEESSGMLEQPGVVAALLKVAASVEWSVLKPYRNTIELNLIHVRQLMLAFA